MFLTKESLFFHSLASIVLTQDIHILKMYTKCAKQTNQPYIATTLSKFARQITKLLGSHIPSQRGCHQISLHCIVTQYIDHQVQYKQLRHGFFCCQRAGLVALHCVVTKYNDDDAMDDMLLS